MSTTKPNIEALDKLVGKVQVIELVGGHFDGHTITSRGSLPDYVCPEPAPTPPASTTSPIESQFQADYKFIMRQRYIRSTATRNGHHLYFQSDV